MTSQTTHPTVTAIVPMRHSSERIPHKNFTDFRGKPLFCHIVDSLFESRGVDSVVIDTDSDRIRDECADRYPSALVLERPAHLRDGGISMNEVLLNCIGQLDGDNFLQTHSTNPLLRPSTIDLAVAAYFKHRATHDSLFGVTRWQTRLYRSDGSAVNHDPKVLARTQDLEPMFEENSNLYIFSRDTIASGGTRIGRTPQLFEIDRLEATDIDDMTGWKLAEAIAASGLL
ncbi:MAG: acylneuraminate cytidylyltransferase family protein [Planctomycetota bacterium]